MEPFEFVDGKECLKGFREIDGKVDAVVIDHEIAFDNDLMLIVNIKRIILKLKLLLLKKNKKD